MSLADTNSGTGIGTVSEIGTTEKTADEDQKSTTTPHYNILSIDGGGIRGIIPTMVIQFMEQEAYKYAVEKKYIQENDD